MIFQVAAPEEFPRAVLAAMWLVPGMFLLVHHQRVPRLADFITDVAPVLVVLTVNSRDMILQRRFLPDYDIAYGTLERVC